MSSVVSDKITKRLDLSTFELEPGATLIEASAGTGKTYTIQYIVLDLLLKDILLSEILVVTFTEAATKELRSRLQSFLVSVSMILEGSEVAADPLEAVLKRGKARIGREAMSLIIRRALLHMDEAPIYTIHGFCQRALSENAFAADTLFEANVCTDPSVLIEGLVRDFLRILNFELPCPLPEKGFGFEELKQRAYLLQNILRLRVNSDVSLKELTESLRECSAKLYTYSETYESILEEFTSFRDRLKANTYPDKFFKQLPSLLQQVVTDPFSCDLRLLRKLSASAIQDGFKKKYQATEFQSSFFMACERFTQAQIDYKSQLITYFDQWFVRSFNHLKQEQGHITYDDMILNLDRSLQRHSLFCDQLRRRYRAALVDEFQDTDARQYRIFQRMFALQAGDSIPRFFGMIGDPKQSIYSFRGADIDAYLEARSDANHSYTLTRNYRSEPEMVAGVNQFFKQTEFGNSEVSTPDRKIPFKPVEAFEGQATSRLRFAGEIDLPRLFERSQMAPSDGKVKTAGDLILQTMVNDLKTFLSIAQSGRILIESIDASSKEIQSRPVHPGDIAVLVDTNKEAAAVQALMQEVNVMAVRTKSGDIFQTEEALTFLQFLTACLRPNESHLNVLLVSPLYGKNASDLDTFTGGERRETYELFSRLGLLWKNGASVSMIWEHFMSSIGLRSRLLMQKGGERRLTNYNHLAEFSQEMEKAELMSPEGLLRRLQLLIKEGESSDSSDSDKHLIRLESDQNAVKIITMHSSKGLEFPVVFLPTLWQKTLRLKQTERAILDAQDPDCLIEIKTDRDYFKEKLKAEAIRIGYVSMTRSVHLCVYYNCRGLPKQHARSNHALGWFDQWLNEQRGEAIQQAEDLAVIFEDLKKAPVLQKVELEESPAVKSRALSRLIADTYQITSYSSLLYQKQSEANSLVEAMSSSNFEVFDSEGVNDSEISELGIVMGSDSTLLLKSFPPGVRTGTCIHEVMEICDFSQPDNWQLLAQEKIRQHFPEQTDQVRQDRVSDLLKLLDRVVKEPIQNNNFSEISLSELKKEASFSEMEFYFPVEQVDMQRLHEVIAQWSRRNGLNYPLNALAGKSIRGYLTGSIDLVFCLNNRYYILDWKTNSPLPGMERSRYSYTRSGMHQQMLHGHYYLQALIYSVALYALLKQRLAPPYVWDQQTGGFIYGFVRGLGTGTGWYTGVFSESDILRAWRALGGSEPLMGKEGRV